MRHLIPLLLILSLTLTLQAKTRKVAYIVLDGIPADYIERVAPRTIFEVAKVGAYARAVTGGEIGAYSQTPTISAIGYMNILTGTWMNKHNVTGNSNLQPNYNYWSIFRIAKEQKKNYKTAIFSSWVDNRKVLIGEGKAETNNLKIDYVFDGYDRDSVHFAPKPEHLQIFDIDSVVCKAASTTIRESAPDLSWVYLWYTDAGYHLKGDGQFMDDYVRKTDELIAPIWEAVQYREKNYDEEWLFIITTDHGRNESGHDHGGQNERERSVWISTNQKSVNEHFNRKSLALTDITPSICSFMNFELPQAIYFEQDGISFLGKTDIYDLRTAPFDNNVTLKWECDKSNENVDIYIATDNKFKTGGTDNWIKVGSGKAKDKSFTVDLSNYATSKFYKFVVATPNNKLTRWLRK